jgi:uncharacterized surface protein with fasciclin (FAS1) repeats
MSKTIAQLLELDTQFTFFISLIKLAGLYERLNKGGYLTVLAPVNLAFEKVNHNDYARLINESHANLVSAMEYYILPGQFKLNQLRNDLKIITLNGTEIHVNVTDHGIRVNTSTIGKYKIASNGIIHALDSVLMEIL